MWSLLQRPMCAFSKLFNKNPCSKTLFNYSETLRSFSYSCNSPIFKWLPLQLSPTSPTFNLQSCSVHYTKNPKIEKWSFRHGKRKTNKEVIKRYFRLHWGIWIRTKAGHHKRLHTKLRRLHEVRRHVFCNEVYNEMFDRMVTSYWRKPKHYVDDPYAPYHQRENFIFTRKEPL